jgi:hypothetical protein
VIEVAIELGDFASGVDAAALHAELVAVGLLPVAVSVSAGVLVSFDRELSRQQLGQLGAVVRDHDAPAAALTLARSALKAAAAERLADLQDFREAAAKSREQLDTEGAAVESSIDAAPDEATARAIAEAYTRRKL